MRNLSPLANLSGGGGGGGGGSLPAPPVGVGFYLLQAAAGPTYSWVIATQDEIGPAFAITSFGGAQTVECGASIVNPSFTASYSSPASSAQITNTDAIDSPHVLLTPFTAATLAGTFTKTAVNAVTTFTLTAVAATTKTATAAFTWLARSFGGVGTAGATSATASGNTAVLVGAAGTLATNALLANPIGSSFGPFAPSGQKIYLQLPHTATPHTFRDQTGFSFAMNAPTTFSFTNQNGAAISMDLYESAILLSTSFTVTVVT
jgi:hypothetical protein